MGTWVENVYSPYSTKEPPEFDAKAKLTQSDGMDESCISCCIAS